MAGDASTESAPPRVCAVLVHYRTPELLAEAVASLRAQDPPPAEIVVVDNEAAEAGRAAPPAPGDYRWLAAPSNVGFAAACNLGARETSGDLLLFVNPDVRLEPGALAALTARLAADRSVAVAAPRIHSGGTVELNARAFPGVRTGLVGRTTAWTRLLARLGRVPRDLEAAHGGEGRHVDWVSGACMLVRRADFDRVGGFDEGYWMYWEDADLCRRLHEAGRLTYYEPRAVAHHRTSASGASPRTVRAFHESAYRYAARHVLRRPASRRLARAALSLRMRRRLRRVS